MTSAVTLFCEDIREEVGGSVSLVGILPDNLGVPGPGGALPKLGIYTRIVLAVDAEPIPMQVLLRKPTGETDILAVFTSDFITETQRLGRDKGNPVATFVSTGMASPFPVPQLGRYLVVLKAGDTEMVSGGLNFEVSETGEESRSTDDVSASEPVG